MSQLHSEFRAHVDVDENHLFPKLRLAVHPYVLDSLAKKLRVMQKGAR